MIRQFAIWIVRSIEVMRTRRRLARLDDDALLDLGLARDEAMVEAARPFWDWEAYGGAQRQFSLRARTVRRAMAGDGTC